jgi:hypothetical protein
MEFTWFDGKLEVDAPEMLDASCTRIKTGRLGSVEIKP